YHHYHLLTHILHILISPSPFHHSTSLSLFFFPDPAPTEIYTLSLHDALPICEWRSSPAAARASAEGLRSLLRRTDVTSRKRAQSDRKSTRLNSSHDQISYAVFCLKKKKTNKAAKLCSKTVKMHNLHA